ADRCRQSAPETRRRRFPELQPVTGQHGGAEGRLGQPGDRGASRPDRPCRLVGSFHPAQLLRLPFAVGGSAAGPPPAEAVLTDQQVEDGPDKGEDENDRQPGQGNPNPETPPDDTPRQT